MREHDPTRGMPWRKDRPRNPGELEFHLPGERGVPRHDDEWLEERARKLQRRHEEH